MPRDEAIKSPTSLTQPQPPYHRKALTKLPMVMTVQQNQRHQRQRNRRRGKKRMDSCCNTGDGHEQTRHRNRDETPYPPGKTVGDQANANARHNRCDQSTITTDFMLAGCSAK